MAYRRGFSVFARAACAAAVSRVPFATFRASKAPVLKKGALRLAAATTLAAATVASVWEVKADKDYVQRIRKIEPKIREAIAAILDDETYDGHGSYGPVFLRLAWHASGTFDKDTNTGGSNGATMRFSPEANHGANAGLHVARQKLESVKKQFPEISYADLWTLAGVVAISEMGGPSVPWRPGRSDYAKEAAVFPPDGRLPDASKDQKHVRDVFYRMGFNDREIVALIGAHAVGKCHTDRSGYDGPWTRSPTTFSNQFFELLLKEKWTARKWNGPKQLQNDQKDLMMLPTDFAFMDDPQFRQYVELYAKDEDAFFKDFSTAFQKLTELGVPFPEGSSFSIRGLLDAAGLGGFLNSK